MCDKKDEILKNPPPNGQYIALTISDDYKYIKLVKNELFVNDLVLVLEKSHKLGLIIAQNTIYNKNPLNALSP